MPDDSQNNRLLLAENDGTGEISCDMEAFFEFSFYMAEELEDLVAQWKHTTPQITLHDRNALCIDEETQW